MGILFWRRNKKKRINEDIDTQYDILPEDKIELDEFDIKKINTPDKEEYIASINSTISELERKNAAIKAEYKATGSYLSDIQLIETMPEEEHEKLVRLAKHIRDLSIDRKIYQTTDSKISTSRYLSMQNHENEIKEDIKQMGNEEKYVQMVRHDMKIIEAEKFGLRQDAKELVEEQKFVNQITLISFLALVSVFLVYIFSLAIKPETTKDIVFLSIILFVLVLVTGVFLISRKIKYNVILTEKKLNRAIVLHNKLKIKYVNASNTLEYRKTKYDVDSAYELGRLYELYLEAKNEKEKYKKTAGEIETATTRLITLLDTLDLYDSQIWQNDVKPLIDKREMVEVRHKLNTRRQKLREQLERNNKLIDEAKITISLYNISANIMK